MLVLTRGVKDEIVLQIGDEVVRVVVASIRGRQVRIGLEAPASIKIDRREVRERRKAG